MADLAASNVTVALVKRGRIPGFAHMGLVTMSFGNTALTVPAAGIPLPADLKKFGVRGEIFFMQLQGPPADGLKYEYDKANHKLLVRQVPGFTPAGSVAAPVFTGTPISPGTPAGTVAKATPAGTVDPGTHVFTGAELAAQAFAGSAMGNITPAGSNAAPAFTGSAVAAAPLAAYTGAIAPTVVRAMVYGY